MRHSARESDREGPVTRSSIAADLRALGVREGSTVIVHTSLSSLGLVVGGEQTVVEALRDVVGADGTLVMPTQSWQLCDPAYLNDSAIPREWWPAIRDHLPVYDPVVTPTRTMGAVAELFRKLPGTLRSSHPHRSFAANGPNAAKIVARHELESPVGEGSPLAALYKLRADVLLLGVGHEKNTALHLAEHRCDYPGKHLVRNGAALLVAGERRWTSWDELWVADDDFAEVGEAFGDDTGLERTASIGQAVGRLAQMQQLVGFAATWFPARRDAATFGRNTTGW